MDRYNEYKDSGIQWIGEIPSHWNAVPIKRIAIFSPKKKRFLADDEWVGYAPMERIRCCNMTPTKIQVKKLSTGLTYFEEGDIVMAKVTPCFENGNTAIVPKMVNKFGYGSSELFVYRCKDIVNKYYLLFNLINQSFTCWRN